MEAPYLILHKVRGEPAFDIAEKIQIGDEEGWIIPTSGHRAYPYWQAPLSEVSVFDMLIGGMDLNIIPEDWPDHYQNTRSADVGPEIDFSPLINEFRPVFRRRF